MLSEKEINDHREIFKEISNKLVFSDKYQKILFFIFCIAVFAAFLPLTNYTHQKNLPEFSCLKLETVNEMFSSYDVGLTNDIKKLPTEERNKLYATFNNLFSSPVKDYNKIKISKDEKCILKNCYPTEHQKKYHIDEEERHKKYDMDELDLNTLGDNPYVILIVNYESLVNWISYYDAFCDFDEFFNILSTIINIARIVGSLIFSFIGDKFGRDIVFKYSITQMIIFYVLIFIFNSRFFFYIFLFVTASHLSLYFSVIVMSSELMKMTYFSFLNSLMSLFFSLSGLMCLSVMILFQNYFYILYIQVIILLTCAYFMKNYIIETFSFSLLNNQFEQSLSNIYHLNIIFNQKIEDDKKIANDLLKLEEFVKKFKTYNSNSSQPDIKHNTTDKDKSSCIAKTHKLEFQNDFDMTTTVNNFNKDYNLEDDHLICKKETKSEVSHSDDEKNLFRKLFGPYFEILMNKEHILSYFNFLPLYMTVNLIYYGQLFYIEKITDNVYFGTLIIFSSEITGEVLLIFYLHKTKRKQAIIFCSASAGIIYLIADLSDYDTIKLVLCFIGSVMISFMFIVAYVLSTETFDVGIKSTMNSLLSNSSYFAIICLPYIFLFFRSIFIFFAFLCFITLITSRSIKETFKEEQK